MSYLSAMLIGNQLRRERRRAQQYHSRKPRQVAGGSRTTITFTLFRNGSPPTSRHGDGHGRQVGFLPLAQHPRSILVEETFARSMAGAVTDPGSNPTFDRP
ncbi:MAG: hypothetical protein U5N21_08105 [Rhodococcus sp. (in: high G+C Gram-positive bacteria)]|nr:hypothetical protein [Rhodococcus sp. (in: high G+C Gram-positive bacteria)]